LKSFAFIKIFLCASAPLWLNFSYSQNTDSLALKIDTVKPALPDSIKLKKHSPKMASIMSAALPGLGQIYNKKYWKVPIIYAAFAADYFAYAYNHEGYKTYKKAYLYRTDDDSTTIDEFVDLLDDETLKSERDEFRKFRDLNYIIAVGIYILNIVDASVDAHLFYFDVSDDLSLEFKPALGKGMGTAWAGIGININIKN
jgi:hypothetical protein